jgi:EAL domain-containing protein (putative c-di-GMP-specific phosphodiesterase class I)
MKFIDHTLSFAQEKEREKRFKLALRMGLPIFAFATLLTFSLLSEYFSQIPPSFLIIAVGILAIMVYFFFYMLYTGFEERIIDSSTETLRREYIFSLFKNMIKREKDYTIALISIDNINNINEEYGFTNGDAVLKEFSEKISKFFFEKLAMKVPIGHLKGGDFVVGFNGKKIDFKSIVDILTLKLDSTEINSIVIYVSSSVIDSTYSNDINHIINRLYYLKLNNNSDERSLIDPNRLEELIIKAIKDQRVSVKFQKVENANEKIFEESVKLLDENGKYIHQKEFMPVISRLGINKIYDQMLVDITIENLKKYSDISIAVKISMISIRDKNFYDYLHSHIISDHKLNGRFIFIIGEKEYYRDIKKLNTTLLNYRNLGIKIVLENFGIDSTSLEYLKNLDIEIVRFDQTYVKNIDNEKYRALFEGLLFAIKKMECKSWVKMVENKQSYEIFQTLNVDYIQGNYISHIDELNNL